MRSTWLPAWTRASIIPILFLIQTGCIPPTYISHIDYRLKNVSYNDLGATNIRPVIIHANITRRKKPVRPEDNAKFQNDMVLYLRASHLFSTVNTDDSGNGSVLTIDINYFPKGSGVVHLIKEIAPLPWTWTDEYEVKASYSDNSGSLTAKSYNYDFETTPSRYYGTYEPGSLLPREGRERMVETILLKFLTDLKTDGVIQ